MVLETILGKIAKKAGNLALNQIVKESSRLSGARKDLFWIRSLMRCIQSFLKDAEALQFKTNLESNFMSEMWDLAYDVEDIIDEYFPKLIPSKSPWRHMIIARGFAKEVEIIKERAKDITDAIQSFKIDKSSCCEVVARDPRPPNFPHCNEPNVVGLGEQIIENLVQRLSSEDSHHVVVVSIIGMPGVGKTTLAKKVYNAVRQRTIFYCSAWIVVSQHPNTPKHRRAFARHSKICGLAGGSDESQF